MDGLPRRVCGSIGSCLIALLIWTGACWGGPRLALVIGNDAYAPPDDLPSCVNDAKAFAGWLTTVGFEPREVALVTDATKSQMIGQLEALVRATQQRRHDQVVIFYSGHGSTMQDDNGDEGPGDDTDEVLVAINQPGQGDAPDKYVIRDDDFYRFVEQIAAHTDQIVVVFDCCHSGGAIKGGPGTTARPKGPRKYISEASLYRRSAGAGASTKGLRANAPATPKGSSDDAAAKDALAETGRAKSPKSLVFLSASNEFQSSYAAEEGEQLSPFTRAFLDLVRPKTGNAPQDMTLDQLHNMLVARLRGLQTPLLKTEGISARTPVVPQVFPSPSEIERQRRFAAVLERLVLAQAGQDSRGKVEIHCDPPGAIAIGQSYELLVKPSDRGYLVVFAVQADGEVTFYYPNKYARDNAVSAATVVPIPGGGEKFYAIPPAGQERFYVYLLEQNPFQGFDFDQCEGGLLVGKIDDVVRRYSRIRSVEEFQAMLERQVSLNSGCAVVLVRTVPR